jgi:hypothetical protein
MSCGVQHSPYSISKNCKSHFYKIRQCRRRWNTIILLSMEALHVQVTKAAVPHNMIALCNQCRISDIHSLTIHGGEPPLWCPVAH